MTTTGIRAVRSAAFAAAFAATAGLAASASAQANGDLQIIEEDTLVQAGGCGVNEPLATGRVIIGNRGDGPAVPRGRTAQPAVAIYALDSVDTLVRSPEDFERMEAREADAIFFAIGEDTVKIGRIGTTFGRGGAVRAQTRGAEASLTPRGRRQVQTALGRLGFDAGAADGVFGRNTRTAIRAFQRAINAAATGILTSGQIDELRRRTGLRIPSTDGGGDDEPTSGQTIRVTIVIIADPYNVVDETNEANNVYRVTIDVNC